MAKSVRSAKEEHTSGERTAGEFAAPAITRCLVAVRLAPLLKDALPVKIDTLNSVLSVTAASGDDFRNLIYLKNLSII